MKPFFDEPKTVNFYENHRGFTTFRNGACEAYFQVWGISIFIIYASSGRQENEQLAIKMNCVTNDECLRRDTLYQDFTPTFLYWICDKCARAVAHMPPCKLHVKYVWYGLQCHHRRNLSVWWDIVWKCIHAFWSIYVFGHWFPGTCTMVQSNQESRRKYWANH